MPVPPRPVPGWPPGEGDNDPSGNELEVLWVVPRDAWGALEHGAPVLPLDLDAELHRWGAARTA